jgi:hypothetical protein
VGARYYDAQVGRFITRHTYLDQHPYLYCEHNPINAADPSGHDFAIIGFEFTPIVGGFGASISIGIVIGEGGIGITGSIISGPGYGTPALASGPSVGWGPGAVNTGGGPVVGGSGVIGVGPGGAMTFITGPGGTSATVGGPGIGGGAFGGGGGSGTVNISRPIVGLINDYIVKPGKALQDWIEGQIRGLYR